MAFPIQIFNATILFIFFAFLASLVNLFLKRTKKLSKDNAQCVQRPCLARPARFFFFPASAHLSPRTPLNPQALLRVHHRRHRVPVADVALHVAAPVAPADCAHLAVDVARRGRGRRRGAPLDNREREKRK